MQGVERAIARIARRQDNVISWERLLGAGLGRGAIAHRLQAGSMQRLHRTVYLLGAAQAAFQEALYRKIVTERPLLAIIKREPSRRGAPVIRALIDDPRMTRSEKERALLRLIDAAQLPRPVTNVRVHGYLIDAFWPAERLAVEFDGRDAHSHLLAFERNRKRDQVLLAHGIRVMRVTGRHLHDEPVAVAVRIGQALTAA